MQAGLEHPKALGAIVRMLRESLREGFKATPDCTIAKNNKLDVLHSPVVRADNISCCLVRE
jgi:hypothetical protein